MEEKVYEVEMMYIQNTSENNYSIEFAGRRCKQLKLNFAKVEGIEFSSEKALEVKHCYLQMAEGESKVWNLRFAYPTNFRIKFFKKIIIDVL